jgi:hypothetical protein
LVVSVIKELAGRRRDDGMVKTGRLVLAGSGAIGFELANLVFAGRVGRWPWRLVLLLAGSGVIGFELANLILLRL